MIQHCFDCCRTCVDGEPSITIDRSLLRTGRGRPAVDTSCWIPYRNIGRRRISSSISARMMTDPVHHHNHWPARSLRFPPAAVLLLAMCFLVPASAQQVQSPTADVGNNNDNGEYFQSQPQTTPYFVRAGEPGPTLQCAATPKYAQDSQYRLTWLKVSQSGKPRIISQGQDNYLPGQYDLDAGNSCHGCYNLRMRNVSFDEDNARFTCQLLGPNSFFKDSNVANVVVLVRPGPPQLSDQSTKGPLREGQVAQLDCQSIGGNPPPRITWRFENTTDVTAFARVRNASNLLLPTISSLVWTVSYLDNRQSVSCFVWNEAMGESTAPMEARSSSFSVQYAPKVRVGPSNPYSVEEMTEANLNCSVDANPPARSYEWSMSSPSNNSPLTSNSQNWSLQVTRQHRGTYTCTARNDEGTGQDSLMLDVQYAPKITFVSGNTNQSSSAAVLVSENQAVSVTCQPDANPPATAVVWTGPQGRTLSDNAVLTLAAISRDDAGNYTCTSKNTLTTYGAAAGPVERQGSGVLEVNVKHAPGKAVIAESEPAVVGGTVNLSCSADDPGAPWAQFRWKAPGQHDYEMVARATYTIENVQLERAGEYWCLPYNEVGPGQPSSHRLIIYQPAQIEERLKPEDQKREGEPYELTCSARGHPAPNITWYKDDELIVTSDHWSNTSNVESTSGDCGGGGGDPNSQAAGSGASNDQCSYKVTGTLKWLDGIRWTDKGYISCHAYNGAGRPSESKTLLKVQHKPVIVNDPSRPYVAAELGQQAVIECKASANPEPLFRWTRAGQQGDLAASDSAAGSGANQQQYQMTMAKVNQSYDLFEQTLVIKRVGEDDFGDYLCKASNQLGESILKFKLQKKTKPYAPEGLESTSEKTHRSLELSWVPGFDGGYEQTFTIEQVEDGLTYNVSEAAAVSSSAQSLRVRRHVGIEKAIKARYNITNLLPSRTYSFRIKAWNRLGETEWSDKISAMTSDAPIDHDIKKPDQPVYNADSNVLEVRPTLDPGKYCLLIYLRQPSGAWEMWNCVDPDSSIRDVPPASNMRVRFCNRYTMYCSEQTDVMTGVGAGFPTPIIVAICVAAVVLLALAGVIFFCCLRSRRQKQAAGQTSSSSSGGGGCFGRTSGEKSNKEQNSASKKQKKPSSATNTASRNGTAKDYEMETNQARPKAISGPYLTSKTPGPVLGLGVDQNTGSSKDSGVFTTSSATNNHHYPYDSTNASARNGGNAYITEPSSSLNGGAHHRRGQSPMGNGNGNGRMVLNRPPSYDGHEHWCATDGYGLGSNGAGGAYLNEHQPLSARGGGGHDFHDGGAMDAAGHHYDGNTPTSVVSSVAGPAAFVDPYGAVGFVDMNPNGSGGGGGSGSGSNGAGPGDDSMQSGYSTPTQRRIMREIIV